MRHQGTVYSHQWKVYVSMHVCKYVPEGNMCTGEEGQLCPINSLTPLHSPTTDNAIQLHNKSKDKSTKQLGKYRGQPCKVFFSVNCPSVSIYLNTTFSCINSSLPLGLLVSLPSLPLSTSFLLHRKTSSTAQNCYYVCGKFVASGTST